MTWSLQRIVEGGWLLPAIVCAALLIGGCGDGSNVVSEAEKTATQELMKSGARIRAKRGQTRASRIDCSTRELSDHDLANIGQCLMLQDLILVRAKFDEAALSHLEKLTRLQRLSLKETPLTDAGLVHVGKLTALVELDLEGTQITDAGLAELHGLKNLRKLYHRGSGVTSSGYDELKGVLPGL